MKSAQCFENKGVAGGPGSKKCAYVVNANGVEGLPETYDSNRKVEFTDEHGTDRYTFK